MSSITGFMSIMVSLYTVLIFHPLENDVANVICSLILFITYWAMMMLGDFYEGKFDKRIKKLEKKLEDMEKGGESDA